MDRFLEVQTFNAIPVTCGIRHLAPLCGIFKAEHPLTTLDD